MSDEHSVEGAQSEPAVLPPAAETQEQIGDEALKVAEDTVEAAVPAAVEGEASGGAPAAFDAGLDAGEVIVEKEAPKVLGKEWDTIKAWVRKELHLAQQGHSVETRAARNP